MNKYASLVDKVKVLINPNLAGKGGKVLKGIGLGAALGTPLGAVGGVGGGLLAADRLVNRSKSIPERFINVMIGVPAYAITGGVLGTGAGLVGGAAAGGALGYAAKRAAIAKAKAAQKQVLLGAAGIGGAGAIGGGAYYAGSRK